MGPERMNGAIGINAWHDYGYRRLGHFLNEYI
jgi:hypothetical protein